MAYNQRPRFGAPQQEYNQYQEPASSYPSYPQDYPHAERTGGYGYEARSNYDEDVLQPFPNRNPPRNSSPNKYHEPGRPPARERQDQPISGSGRRQHDHNQYEGEQNYSNSYQRDMPYENPRARWQPRNHAGPRNVVTAPDPQSYEYQDEGIKSPVNPSYEADGAYYQKPPGARRSEESYTGQTRQSARRPANNGHVPAQGRSRQDFEAQKSPDTVAWDNPFPTFPAKLRKDSPDISDERHNVAEEDAGRQNHESRPPTANGRSSHDTQRSSKERRNEASLANGRNTAPVERPLMSRNARSDSEHVRGHAPGQGSYNPMYSEKLTVDNDFDSQIQNSTTLQRDIPNEPIRETYDRSRTMPAAIADSFNARLGAPDSPAWQEPGGFSGYHGPEDRGFLPVDAPIKDPSMYNYQSWVAEANRSRNDISHDRRNPNVVPSNSIDGNRNMSQQNSRIIPLGPVHSYSDEARNYKSSRSQGPSERRVNPRPPPNGFEEDINAYPSKIRTGGQPLPPRDAQGWDGRMHSADEMPNFGGPQRRPANPYEPMAFDNRLGSPVKAQSPPALPEHQLYHPPQIHAAPQFESDPIPRSRSQPVNYDRHPPPPPPHGEGPAYGTGFQPERRPATSSASTRPGPPGRAATGLQADRREDRPLPRLPQQQGPPANWNSGPQSRPSLDGGPNGQPGQGGSYAYAPPRINNGRPQDQGRTQGPSPQGRPMQIPAPANPDALPHHPAPVRPGVNGSTGIPNGKPPPVRHYNNSPSAQGPGRVPPKDEPKGPKAVTYQDLDRLRQKVNSNPDDQETRMTLAKKLMEASTVLVDERADSRTRAKARDDYIAQASKIIKKLAGSNYPEAMFYLGDCYSRGALGYPSDVKEAFTLYQSAAKANHAQAAYRVAVCCEIGQDEGGGTRKDPVKAVQWYKRAATLGDTSGMYKMGIIQLKGLLGQPKNSKDAMTWLKKAAERADGENPHALHELALLYEKAPSIEGVPKDEPQAKLLFTQAANFGYKFSQFRLGSAFEYGQMGCAVDPRQSIAWYSKAAAQGEHQSELALSGWYLTGSEGVLQQSDTEAYLWARKAAQAGLAKAEYAMGYFTEVGIGAPANVEDAKRWYWRAASQNFPKARERLEELRKGGAVKQKARVSRSNMKKQSDGECVIM